MQEQNLDIVNNPLLPQGRIGRLTYFITETILTFCGHLLIYIDSVRNKFDTISLLTIIAMIFVCIIACFAVVKRLRDIQWRDWTLLMLFIPIIGIFFSLSLCFIKSKYD